MKRGFPEAIVWMVAVVAAMLGLAATLAAEPTGVIRVVQVALMGVVVIALLLNYRATRAAEATIRSQQREIEGAALLRLQIIEALSLAIDARDRTTQSIRREQRYAEALARAFGMPDAEVEAVRTAALLHDVGKLAVPDHILTKPGPLDPDELKQVRIHPQVGAGIIAGVPFPAPVAPLVLTHHERWDGTGYPAGLRGTEIPLGARVLSCVDYYEALTADRPFHRAMSHQEAVAVLWSEAGKALDPAVVARFSDLLPTLQPSAGGTSADHAQAAPREDRGVLQDITQANSEIGSLYDISRAIGTTLGIVDSMTVIAAKLQSLVPFDACALFLHGPADDMLHARFASGVDSEHLLAVSVPMGSGLVGRVAQTRECVMNGDPMVDLLPEDAPREPWVFSTALACPLVVSDSVVGVLALYRHAQAGFTETHRRLVHAVSEQAAAVILNSVIFEQTQTDSVTDALTGLPNIRLLFVHLSRELARATRLSSPVSLLLLDMDGLKYLNDTYGHSVGDHALCKVATALAGSIRPYDLCVRYGGDEFIIVLSGCGRDEAEAKLRELQDSIDKVVFDVPGLPRIRLSVSGGAAVFPDDGKSYETLLSLADRRMYRDKAARKQLAGADPAAPAKMSPSHVELERAAMGVL
jgi:diguanylate cyclase (GGDEF)-like protein